MRFLNRLFFFIGWLLSPLTIWNDVFINIPLAYISASLFFKIFPRNFALQVIVFYWLGNAIGLLMMYVTSRNVLKEKHLTLRSILVTLLIYSIILLLLDKFVVLRPVI
ncbi:MAG: hypothetical protein KKH77_06995 [Candidatus Omnitrophica bacterium]|nr:hypothetical protein [Candidatus Omnitrophota bacterium]MBU0881238.1 hypothetical protein [Candidatus Omnitrophota bacterium]MBU1808125.1 hypothetical protein [Candidatus Omnitrophota bacterium]